MKRAAESRLILIVRVNINILIGLQAIEMVVFMTGANDALLNVFCGVFTR